MVIPFIGKISDVGNRYVNAFVSRALYKCRKAVMVSADVDKLPMIVLTHSAKVVDIFGLKRFVVIAGVTTRRKLITYVFFQVFYVCHSDYLLKII